MFLDTIRYTCGICVNIYVYLYIYICSCVWRVCGRVHVYMYVLQFVERQSETIRGLSIHFFPASKQLGQLSRCVSNEMTNSRVSHG